MLFFAAGSISENAASRLVPAYISPPPKHPHQRELCFTLITGLTDGAIDGCKVNVVLLDPRFETPEFLLELIQQLHLIAQPLQIEWQLLDGEDGRIESNILLNLLLEFIEFCHSVIPLLHTGINR